MPHSLSLTLSDIATALGVTALGDGALPVTGLAEPSDAGPRDLALAMDRKYADSLHSSQAEAAIVWQGADWQSLGLKGAIVIDRAGAALPELTRLMARAPDIASGIHPTAYIDDSASLGAGAAIGPFVSIGAGAVIGENARIASHVSIGREVTIGAGCLLHPGVRICAGTHIGDDFICHPNAVLGSDGFSFKSVDQASAVERLRASIGTGSGHDAGIEGTTHWARVFTLGGLVIGDDCEIGAGTTVDGGTIRATTIGRGTKVDNQVQIGHNCEIGEGCLICGASAIAGSVTIGNRVVLGGQTGVADNLSIGDDVISGATTAIFSNVPSGRAVWGTPAVKMETQIAIYKGWRRLPRLVEDMRALKAQVAALVAKDTKS